MDYLNSTISSSDDETLIATINNVTLEITRYFSIFIFLFGSIGNILNIIILSQSSFRPSPCAQLFLFASIMNLVAIVSGLTSRILSGWGADLTATNQFVCKFRGFIVNTARPVAVWYILFAMIDRWLLSSLKVERRQMSSLKNAHRAMVISLTVATICFSHVLYCQEPNQINAPQKCYGATLTCRYVTDLSFTLFCILPLIPMLVCGLMTIYNIQQSRSRIGAAHLSGAVMVARMTSNQKRRQKKIDHNLLIMLLAQILILCILSLPLGIEKLYSSVSDSRSSTKLQAAIDHLAYNIAQLLHFLSNGMPFYIYTLTGGKSFRKVLLKFLVNLKEKIWHG